MYDYLTSNGVDASVRVFPEKVKERTQTFIVLITTQADKQSKFSNIVETLLKSQVKTLGNYDLDIYWKFIVIEPVNIKEHVEIKSNITDDNELSTTVVGVENATMEKFTALMDKDAKL